MIPILASAAFGQANAPTRTTKPAAKQAPAQKSAVPRTTAKLDPSRQFVLDVVKTAVSLPQADQQDRLRVLAPAASVAGTVDKKLATSYTNEGAQIESRLIAQGETPAVSLMGNGLVPCSTAVKFMNEIAPQSVAAAEQSMLGALNSCTRQTIEAARQKVEAALNSSVIAPRLLLAVIEQTGAKTPWSQEKFVQMFQSLPRDKKSAKDAANYSAMFVRMAPEVDRGNLRTAALAFLEWLNKLEESGEKNLAINMTVASLSETLGEKGMQEMLEGNVMARQAVNQAGQPGEIEQEEDSVTVLKAYGDADKDVSDTLKDLPVARRAREAAAHGFAMGTEGNKQKAERYFDIAFSSVEDLWRDRAKEKDPEAVVEEVSEAAAHVDPTSALKRAQGLSEPSAQAIGMLAVARVVLGNQLEREDR